MVENKINIDIINSIEKYIEKIKQYYDVDYVILFGSYTKGTHHEENRRIAPPNREQFFQKNRYFNPLRSSF